MDQRYNVIGGQVESLGVGNNLPNLCEPVLGFVSAFVPFVVNFTKEHFTIRELQMPEVAWWHNTFYRKFKNVLKFNSNSGIPGEYSTGMPIHMQTVA
jgi:hypothetical protein